MPTSQAGRAARLLLRALESLKPSDQKVVLEAFLTGSIGRGSAHPFGPPVLLSDPTDFRISREVRQMEQPLLVRLPSDLHGRFRRWATANGFSMAAVARGLIERFLEERDRSAS